MLFYLKWPIYKAKHSSAYFNPIFYHCCRKQESLFYFFHFLIKGNAKAYRSKFGDSFNTILNFTFKLNQHINKTGRDGEAA